MSEQINPIPTIQKTIDTKQIELDIVKVNLEIKIQILLREIENAREIVRKDKANLKK